MIDDTSRQDGEQLAMPGFEPEPPAAETIKKQLPVVQFRMDFLRDPEDALAKWGQMENGRYEKWFRGHFDRLVAIVAQQTGADPKQIADKEKRTPEQQRLLLEAAAKQQIARFNPDSEYISIKEQAVLYFFALLAFIERENPTPETAESIAAKLPLVQGIRPTAHTMPNNALMNTLQQKPAINAGAFDMVVANAKGRRKEITAYTMISYEPGETGLAITEEKLSEYERQVSDAIISLWLAAIKGNVPTFFTADMIFREMPGGSDKASPQQKGAITKAIEKFRRLHIYVDATEEFTKRGIIPNGSKYVFDEYYLNVRRHTVQIKNGGAIVQGYEILSKPVMLVYAELTKQLLTVPAKYLAIEKVKQGRASGELVTMTADRQAMTGYMLRRIGVMKNDRKNKVQTQSNVILFDTLFTETGTKTDNRKQTMINRNFCFDVLEYWKVSGFIKGYSKQEKGRSITGIVIEF